MLALLRMVTVVVKCYPAVCLPEATRKEHQQHHYHHHHRHEGNQESVAHGLLPFRLRL